MQNKNQVKWIGGGINKMTSDTKASKQVVELKKAKKSILKWLEYPSTKSKTTLKDRLKHKASWSSKLNNEKKQKTNQKIEPSN